MGLIYVMESLLGKCPPQEREVIITELASRLSKFAKGLQGQILQERLWGEMEGFFMQRGGSPLGM